MPKRPRHFLPLLVLVSLGILSPWQACGRPPAECTNGYSNTSLNPFQSPCTTHCDCNNQLFEGYCIGTRCISYKRESCVTAGQAEYCTLQKHFLPALKVVCEQGTRTCQEDGLKRLYWGNCVCPPQEPSPQEPTPREPAPKPEPQPNSEPTTDTQNIDGAAEPSADTDEPSSDTRNMDAPAEPSADTDAGEPINDTQSTDGSPEPSADTDAGTQEHPQTKEPPSSDNASPQEPTNDGGNQERLQETPPPDPGAPERPQEATPPEPPPKEACMQLCPGWVRWGTPFVGNSKRYGYAMTLDVQRGVYIAGSFEGNYPMDNQQPAQGTSDAYIAKLGPEPVTKGEGKLVQGHHQRITGSGAASIRSIVLDKTTTNTLYVTGEFDGNATFGNIALASKGKKDVFLAKVDLSQGWLWAKQLGGSDDDLAYGITRDANHLYITGSFRGTLQNKPSVGGSDIFVAKFDNKGSLLGFQTAGGAGNDQAQGIALSSTGQLGITGFVSTGGSATFGTVASCTSQGSKDIFVAILDNKFAWQAATCFGGSSNEEGHGIRFHNQHAHITGATEGSFQAATKTHQGVFVAKLDSTAKLVWLTSTSGSGARDSSSRSIDVDSGGNAFVVGDFARSLTFGTITHVADSRYTTSGLFVAKISKDGKWTWSTSSENYINSTVGPLVAFGRVIALDSAGSPHIFSDFGGVISFNGAIYGATPSGPGTGIFAAQFYTP